MNSNEQRPIILLIGNKGQIGWELQRTLILLGKVVAIDFPQLDLADPDQIRSRVREIKPHVIINAAAYAAVDQAEKEADKAMQVNGIAPGILAEEAKRLSASFVHYSTDYVFDGNRAHPYTEEDEPNPLNVYGKTKLAGEHAIQAVDGAYLILRTSWVYGKRGNNFLLTILRLARERDEIRVVNDQIGAPTWCRLVAEGTAQILAQTRLNLHDVKGVYHITSQGETSWYGFASQIVEKAFDPANRRPRVIPIASRDYPALATRPKYSVLSTAKLQRIFNIQLPNWSIGLEMVFDG
ncbi:MAG: dTDP-4-dehydrorhamnose reductase [Firmicutes bacterium]|nr:dTDP-4-dehydrorhamnose reductase [Bacillota bacterium]